MFIEQAIQAELSGNAALELLVAERIYYMRASQSTEKPYIVFSRLSASPDYTHDGNSKLVNARFQFDIFSRTYEEVKSIASIVRGIIEDYSGYMGQSEGEPGLLVNGCFLDDEQDLYEDEIKLYHILQDYVMWFTES